MSVERLLALLALLRDNSAAQVLLLGVPASAAFIVFGVRGIAWPGARPHELGKCRLWLERSGLIALPQELTDADVLALSAAWTRISEWIPIALGIGFLASAGVCGVLFTAMPWLFAGYYGGFPLLAAVLWGMVSFGGVGAVWGISRLPRAPLVGDHAVAGDAARSGEPYRSRWWRLIPLGYLVLAVGLTLLMAPGIFTETPPVDRAQALARAHAWVLAVIPVVMLVGLGIYEAAIRWVRMQASKRMAQEATVSRALAVKLRNQMMSLLYFVQVFAVSTLMFAQCTVFFIAPGPLYKPAWFTLLVFLNYPVMLYVGAGGWRTRRNTDDSFDPHPWRHVKVRRGANTAARG
jgi:hypothetical protein